MSIAVRLLAASLLAASMAVPASAQTRAELDSLARDIEGVESVRAVKDLQRHYAHYVQLGLWDEAAALFSTGGKLVWGDATTQGRAAIAAWLRARGGGADGPAAGVLHTEFIDEPLLSLGDDRTTAQSRWMSLTFAGDGKGRTRIESGVYENDYVIEDGVWKIALAHYHPQFAGDYANGWTNVGGGDLPIVPYHITTDQTGRPIPPVTGDAPGSTATLAQLETRIAVLNDEDAVRNVQNAYGYYVDRKMWDDVVDLFAQGGVVELAGTGRFSGKAGVRQALERMGPAGLRDGEVNDRPLFATLVEVQPDGTEAYSRGIELGMLGDQAKGVASWEISIFHNRFVKEGGLWKLKELRVFPLMKAAYDKGWGDSGTIRPAGIPAFLSANPVTGKPVALASAAATRPLTGAAARAVAAPSGSGAQRYAEAKRRLARSLGFDASENVSSAYGFYIDDFMWDEMGAIFAVKGNKQSPFTGYYLGRDRIMGAVNATWGPAAPTRPGISYHWRTQPVIFVSQDGRSANLRTRLFQPRTGKEVNGTFYGANFSSGMYPNDQLVLEGDVWRLWSLTIDEHYVSMSSWKEGWNGVKPRPPASGPAQPTALSKKFPPDIFLPELGRREEGFRGGIGTPVDWPGIMPMWFNYRNPVSGREPERYWPDCVPCELKPAARMTSFGYQMPPTGPSVDGVVVK
jgi:hypothetical protein